jgi:flagellar hook-basal body complex protein FliE
MDNSIFAQMVPLRPLQPLEPIKSIESIGSLGSARGTEASTGFGKYLNDAINQLNAMQAEANLQSNLLLTGNVEDFHTPIIALEKASLGLGLATTMRNKFIEVYQEIMRMQI